MRVSFIFVLHYFSFFTFPFSGGQFYLVSPVFVYFPADALLSPTSESANSFFDMSGDVVGIRRGCSRTELVSFWTPELRIYRKPRKNLCYHQLLCPRFRCLEAPNTGMPPPIRSLTQRRIRTRTRTLTRRTRIPTRTSTNTGTVNDKDKALTWTHQEHGFGHGLGHGRNHGRGHGRGSGNGRERGHNHGHRHDYELERGHGKWTAKDTETETVTSRTRSRTWSQTQTLTR